MELTKLSITPEFIKRRSVLSWREIAFGIDNDLLSPGAAVDFAVCQIVAHRAADSVVCELAGLRHDDPTRDLVELLAAAEPRANPDDVRKKWLYLVLSWVFEHRDTYEDPLDAVEEIYADFGYPEEVAAFVRYMPMNGPDLGSEEANLRRLYDNWKQYLEWASQFYGHDRR